MQNTDPRPPPAIAHTPDPYESDPFDRVYARWAEHALSERLDPPSREKWDSIVLRLILSEDPARVRRYRQIDVEDSDSLGADTYALWSKLPSYTPDLSAHLKTKAELRTYEAEKRGSMRRLMEAQGLIDKYDAIIEAQEQFKSSAKSEADQARIRKAQRSILMIGCAGLAFMAFMVLTVLLIIAINLVVSS